MMMMNDTHEIEWRKTTESYFFEFIIVWTQTETTDCELSEHSENMLCICTINQGEIIVVRRRHRQRRRLYRSPVLFLSIQTPFQSIVK